MGVDGRWDLTISTPVGQQKVTAEFASDGSVLTGKMVSDSGSEPISDGRINGNEISWTAKLTSPMKITVKANATLDGDTLSGKAKAGVMPAVSFTGVRVA